MLNVLNGAVQATCKPRHRHQEFLAFLREIDTTVPTELDVRCIRTYSSWLKQVERFFALITDKAIRRGSLTSVKQLVQRIDQFVAHHNTNSQPFRWTAAADSILEKLH